MKLLSSSPSISSSSSSTVSFDPTICTPKSSTAGCLSGILRRMLCSRTLPTHPSEHITETNSVPSINGKQEQLISDDDDDDDASKVTPGIVARLMGLDSLPETSLLNARLHPNSITRSRSMNSVEYKQDTASIHGKHRRVNSTLSLRDMPTYFELENEEFFVLSFDKGSERKELKSKQGKCKQGSGGLKQILKENKENRVDEKKMMEDDGQASKRVFTLLNEEKLNRRIAEEAAKCREVNDLCLEKPVSVHSSKCLGKKGSVPDNGAKLRKKRKKLHHPVTQNVEPECSSEDSSPVSVLVFNQFIIDLDVPTSEEDSKAAAEGLNSNPRRKLSPDLDNYGCKSPPNDGNLMEDDDPRDNDTEVKNLESRKKDWHGEKNLEVLDAICRVIETEVAKSSWLLSSNKEQLEDVTADFGSNILDQLLDELVIHLSVISTGTV